MYKRTYRICSHCGKEVISSRHLVHERKCLEQQEEMNRPKKPGHPLGHTPWNKGLTKETSVSVKQYANKLVGRPGTFTGRSHSDETKNRISQKMSVVNKGGRCKWYEVNGQLVQGTWERDVASKLTELGIEWKKIKTNSDTLAYMMDGVQRHYTPDFYLPGDGVYLEVKGFWHGRDKEKMKLVIDQHPEVRIKIIEKNEFIKLMGGELVW